jgi:hydrocephalus-inducing protein
VNTSHAYEVFLENRGDIPIDFGLREQMTLFSSLFSFSPSSGTLRVGETIKIEIRFEPDLLGDVYEEFLWDLAGAPEPLSLTFKGKVISPSLKVDKETLDFGRVPLGFPAESSFFLHNESRIHVAYTTRILDLETGKPLSSKEFKIVNQRGVINDLSSIQIGLEFNPDNVKFYDNVLLVIDIDRVTKEAIKIPVSAQVVVPEVSHTNYVCMN